MPSWGESRTCRASVIRDILRGRLAADPDPHGLRLRGARITGRLDLEYLTSTIVVELTDCFLEEGLTVRGARLPFLNLEGSVLKHRSEPALNAEGLQVDHDVNLRKIVASGSSGDGAVRLTGARIGGSLECDGAELRNDSGPALYADRLQVGQSMFLRYGFTATGHSGYGLVYLVGADISGHLDGTRADLRNDSGPALDAYSLRVGQGMYLGGGFAATGDGSGVTVDLTDARVGGKFVFAPARLEHRTNSHQRLAADGLTYAGVPDTEESAPGWPALLRQGTPGYAAQPYQQLSAGYQARGDDRRARQTLIAQRDDQLARAHPRRWEWLWGRITKITLGYGYQPWKALLFLAGVVIVSCALAVGLGSHGALTQTSRTADPGRSCTVVQQLSVGLDLNLPVGTTVARADCDLTTDPASATAAWLTVTGWVLRLLAWAFAALFIAGFTTAVRKT
jgi:hypothetical protein